MVVSNIMLLCKSTAVIHLDVTQPRHICQKARLHCKSAMSISSPLRPNRRRPRTMKEILGKFSTPPPPAPPRQFFRDGIVTCTLYFLLFTCLAVPDSCGVPESDGGSEGGGSADGSEGGSERDARARWRRRWRQRLPGVQVTFSVTADIFRFFFECYSCFIYFCIRFFCYLYFYPFFFFLAVCVFIDCGFNFYLSLTQCQ